MCIKTQFFKSNAEMFYSTNGPVILRETQKSFRNNKQTQIRDRFES